MSVLNKKLTDLDISTFGVQAAPDKLTGTAQDNKALFDRLISSKIKVLFNGLIDALLSSDAGDAGADNVGTSVIEGMSGTNVQQILQEMKLLLDTKATTDSLALKEDKTVTERHFKDLNFNTATGVLTMTREDGSLKSVNTGLQRMAVNFQFDQEAQKMVLTQADGSTQDVPLSAFISENEFLDSDSIDFSVIDHKITAIIKTGSVTTTMLNAAVTQMLEQYQREAETSAAEAQAAKIAAEGFKNAASTYENGAVQARDTAEGAAVAAATSAQNAGDSARAAAESAAAAEAVLGQLNNVEALLAQI